MDGSDQIFIVLPIVAIIILAILVGLPYLGNRSSRDSHAGSGHSGGHQVQGQIPGHSARADASGGDAIGPGHA